MRKHIFRIFLSAIVVALSACKTDLNSINGDTTAGTGTGTGTTPGGTPPTPVIRLGSFSGSTFNAGVIALSPTASLTAGGNTTLTVSLVDTANSNAPVTGSGNVTFTSNCISQGDSTLSVNPASISTGNATVTYSYSGANCGATDVVTASVIASGGAVTATASITVTPSPATSIEFVSATPTNIGLQGSGQPSTSQVVFAVTNSAGGAVEGQTVNFTLDTSIGGITLSPSTATPPTTASATTGANGQVTITVQAGTVPTSVIVTAGLSDNPATAVNEATTVAPAQSSSLVISTGRPDQDSLSLSIGCFNIEGDDYDGVRTNVNIFASDRFNNPVPDGTPISFRAEGGTIQPSCFTAAGNCSVQFTSSNPRPADHRATILAYSIGEESFNDANGDGRHDSGEIFTDLSDAFVDTDETGTFNAGDTLVDFDGDGAFDAANGLFTGPLCDGTCDTATSLYVRESEIIIMSGSDANIVFSPSTFVDADASGTFTAGDYVDLSSGPVSVVVQVGDSQGQPMPGQTTINGSSTVGGISGTSSYTQLCTTFNGPSNFTFVLDPTGLTADKSGSFTVKVTTPLGTVTETSIPVTFSSVPPPPPPPPAGIGSIRFVSALPTTIGIKGTGLGDTSSVSFQVLTETGAAVSNETVNFSLSTTVGGIIVNPTSVVSDSQGFVRTTVQSGTIHTSVRVAATSTTLNSSTGQPVTAQSDSLVITTGFPDQDSFSLSLSCPNIEGGEIDGTTVGVNLLAADRFNNPVADGTAVAFTTEGGSIVGSCQTAAGGCSVIWTSQDPRPVNGRTTILATALGEESFTDLNGNGTFETGEPFNDLGEAFRDDNENGTYDAASEEFLDFGNGAGGAPDNVRNGASGSFTGVLCSSGCDTATKLHVSDSVIVIMSGSSPDIDTDNAVETDVTCPTCTSYTPATKTFTIANNALASMRFVVRDVRNQPMPNGTTISVEAVGDAGAFIGTTSFSVPCTSNGSAAANTRSFAFDGADAAGTSSSSAFELKVTSPSGVISVFPFSIVKSP